MLNPIKVGYDSSIRFNKTSEITNDIPQDITEAKFCRA
jgi:hypothetical protein